jgi:nickel/cobalt exporter
MVTLSEKNSVEGEMDDREKLLIIIKHWIEHNETHLEEHRQWARKAEGLGLAGVKARITEAMEAISQSNALFKEALKELETL